MPNTIYLKLFLEGACSASGLMGTNNLSDLTLNQPFNVSPWNYNGSETLAQIPSTAIDWLLIEVLDQSLNLIEKQAAILLADGSVASASTLNGVQLYSATIGQEYHFIIRQKNHLDIVSEAILFSPINSYDLSNPSLVLDGNSQLVLNSFGDYVLKAGDLNGDGIVSVSDFNIYYEELQSPSTNSEADLNFDSFITVSDYNYYLQNSSAIGHSLIRY